MNSQRVAPHTPPNAASISPYAPMIFNHPNLFHIWLGWLYELGGTFQPMRDLDECKPTTGRRVKLPIYPVGYHKKFWAAQSAKVAA